MKQIVLFGSLAGSNMSGRVPFAVHVDGHPLFSIGTLRELFKAQNLEMLAPQYLAILAEELNNLAAIFALGKNCHRYQDEYEKLHASLNCIAQWLSDRGLNEAGEAKIAFDALVSEINTTEIDPTGNGLNLLPKAANWKGKNYSEKGMDLASSCGNALNLVRMLAGKQKYGYSNDGPLARFVYAALPSISGEAPSLAHVGKHLKDAHRGAIGTIRE